jgi:hypothetical protein
MESGFYVVDAGTDCCSCCACDLIDRGWIFFVPCFLPQRIVGVVSFNFSVLLVFHCTTAKDQMHLFSSLCSAIHISGFDFFM